MILNSISIRDYWALSKPRVTGLVMLSMIMGYGLGVTHGGSWLNFLSAFLGAWLMVASANGINQAMEAKFDAKMERTKHRPVADGRISVKNAVIVSALWWLLGAVVLYFFTNFLSFVISAVGHLIYVFIYTPAKQKTPLCVIPGALSGALPPLMGFIASVGSVNLLGLELFILQFLWQFPHTWAIGVIHKNDFETAGFRMLPFISDNETKLGLLMAVFSMSVAVMGVIPAFSFGNLASLVIGAFGGVIFVSAIFAYLIHPKKQSARVALMASVFSLPLFFGAYLVI